MEMTLQHVLYIALAALALGFIGIMIAMRRGQNTQKETQPQEVQPQLIQPKAAAAPANDDALIAVITAAIAAMWESDSGFIVRHVRRVHNSPAWLKAGREDQAYGRQ